MSFSALRHGKNQASRPTDRRSRLQAWRPSLERMEDRVVLTAGVAPHQAAVTQLYQDLLHRLPDASGLAYWTGQLDAGADTQAVATALTHSTEFHRGEVDGVYQRLLNRAADEGGRAFFASALDAGQTVQQVESAVASSPEYARTHGGGGFLDALFNGTDHLKSLVSGAYQQVLHRAGDAAGLDYWAGRMSAGASLDDVTANLAVSAEKAAMPAATSAVLGTFSDASALPTGAVGSLETSLAGSVHAALSAGASGSGSGAAPLGVGMQSVTLKNGLPAVFQAFGPERLVDTRNTVSGQYGGPQFTAGGTRTINVAPYNLTDPSIPSAATGDQPPTSNLPNNVVAVSVILFIVGAPQPEYVTAYATGTSPAPIGTASVFADRVGQTIAASAIVPVNASGNIDIYSSGGGNLVVDINGYFLNQLDGTDNLPISGSVPGTTSGVIVGTNTNAGAVNGVLGQVTNAAALGSSAGVKGINASTAGSAYGVQGWALATTPTAGNSGVIGTNFATNSLGSGVLGTHASNGVGVQGQSVGGIGVFGINNAGAGGTGVAGTASGVGSKGGNFTGETGVIGTTNDTGAVFGVLGQVTSTSAAIGSAGVVGTNASTTTGGSTDNAVTGVLGVITSTSPGNFSAGVRGINKSLTGSGIGVLGETAGVAFGVSGIADRPGGSGVAGQAPSGSFAIYSYGNFGASGTKSFVDPSPTDPSKQIAYVALEGPEAGTYFRGTGHFVNGTATIDVPQTFRDVTNADGLSVQVTPVGPTFTNVTVKSLDLNHVVILGSQDVDFYYTVNGVRQGYADFNPLQANTIYVPRSATDTLPNWLNDTQKAKVIADGIYNADGTVNLATAHRLGWDQLWTTTTTSSGAAG